MSLVEQAIAKLREAAGTTDATVRAPPVANARPAMAAGGGEHTAKNSKVLAIDVAAMRANGFLPEESADRQFAERYRQIKRPLVERALSADARAAGSDARVIMITSALPGEGKTFTSINLAFSLARERDISVLLVDADVPKPHISEIFGIRQDPGLMDALVDENLSVESLVMDTDIKGMSVLPAGTLGEGAAELLVSNRMRQVLQQLLGENPRRIVLLDSPPLLATNEGRALTKIAGQIVLVVRAGRTPKHAIMEALGLFDTKRVGGIVLNESHLSLTESFYGYGAYGNESNEKTAAD
jgi:protein-tyrosine kinase